MKILRDEHTEVLHTMFHYEKRNQELVAENQNLFRRLTDPNNQNDLGLNIDSIQ